MNKKFMYININLLILNIVLIFLSVSNFSKNLYSSNSFQEETAEANLSEEELKENDSTPLGEVSYLSGVEDPYVRLDYEEVVALCPYDYVKDISIPDTVKGVALVDCTDSIKFEQEEFDQIKTYEIDNSSYDISYIEKMTNLESLTIKDSTVDEVPYLHNDKLRTLSLVRTNITTIENIEGLKSLEVIEVPNDIKYITKSSYDYIKSNDIKVKIPDHNAQQMVELDIDDLEII